MTASPSEHAPLRLENVSLRYGSLRILDDITFEIRQGDFLCLLGPSGCGKTSIIRIIAGLERRHGGRVLLRGADAINTSPAKRGCGIVFQSYALFPNMTAWSNIAFGMRRGEWDKAAIGRRVREMLDLVGLSSSADKYPSQLSGGEQQRVALARALAPNPELLLLDEPLSALDAQVRLRLRDEILSVQKRLDITTIMVTHDQEEALTMADKIVVMNKGRMVQEASPMDIYQRPATPFAAAFIGSMNFLRGCTAIKPGLLRLGPYTLHTNVTHLAPGGSYMAAVRPEEISLVSRADAGDVDCVAGILEDEGFMGARWRLRVRLDAPVSACLNVDVSPSVREHHAHRPGDRIILHMPSYSLLAYPDQEEC